MKETLKLKVIRLLREYEEVLNKEDTGRTIDSSDIETTIAELEMSVGTYPISSIHKEDFYNSGYIADELSSADFEAIASKMSDDYHEQLYHIQIPYFGELYEAVSIEKLFERWEGIVKDNLTETSENQSLAKRLLSTIGIGYEKITQIDWEGFKHDFATLLGSYNDAHWLDEFTAKSKYLDSYYAWKPEDED